MLVRSASQTSRKELARGVFDTFNNNMMIIINREDLFSALSPESGAQSAFATNAGLIHDVTDTGNWAQNGSTHSYVFATFTRRFLTSRTTYQEEKLL